eukprot:403362470
MNNTFCQRLFLQRHIVYCSIIISLYLNSSVLAYKCYQGNVHTSGGTENQYDKFFDVDFHASTDQAASCGYTSNSNSEFSFSTQYVDRRPMIAKYDLNVNYHWRKAYSTQLNIQLSGAINHCKFSQSGNFIVANMFTGQFYYNTDGLLIVNATDGTAIRAIYVSGDFVTVQSTFYQSSMIMLKDDKTILRLLSEGHDRLILMKIDYTNLAIKQSPVIQKYFSSNFRQQSRALALSLDDKYLYIGYTALQESPYRTGAFKIKTSDFSYVWDKFVEIQNIYTNFWATTNVIDLTYEKSTDTQHILTCHGDLQSWYMHHVSVTYYKESSYSTGGTQPTVRKVWLVNSYLQYFGMAANQDCVDVKMFETEKRFMILVAAPGDDLYSYYQSLSINDDPNTNVLTHRLINNVNNYFGVVVQAAKMISESRFLAAGFLGSVQGNYYYQWAITHTFPWPDYFEPQEYVSPYMGMQAYDLFSESTSDFNHMRLTGNTTYQLFLAKVTTLSVLDTTFPPNNMYDNYKLGNITFQYTPKKYELYNYTIGDPKITIPIAINFQNKQGACVFTQSEFKIEVTIEPTLDLNMYVTMNYASFSLYSHHLNISGEYTVTIKATDFFKNTGMTSFKINLIDFTKIEKFNYVPKPAVFLSKPPNIKIYLDKPVFYKFPQVKDPFMKGYIYMNATFVKLKKIESTNTGSKYSYGEEIALPSFATYTREGIYFNISKPNQDSSTRRNLVTTSSSNIGEYWLKLNLTSQKNETSLYYVQIVIMPQPEIDWKKYNLQKYKYYYNYFFANGTMSVVDFPETTLIDYNYDSGAYLTFDKNLQGFIFESNNTNQTSLYLLNTFEFYYQKYSTETAKIDPMQPLNWTLINITKSSMKVRLEYKGEDLSSFVNENDQIVMYQLKAQNSTSQDVQKLIVKTQTYSIPVDQDSPNYLLKISIESQGQTLAQIASSILFTFTSLMEFQMPSQVYYFFQLTQGIFKFTLLSTYEITKLIFGINKNIYNYYSANYGNFGFQNHLFIFNTDITLYLFIFYPIIILLITIIGFFGRFSVLCNTIKEKLMSYFIFGFFIRLTIQSYLLIMISALLNFVMINDESFEDSFELLSYILAVFFMVFIPLVPITIFACLMKNYKQIKRKKLRNIIGTFFYQISSKSRLKLAYGLFQFSRRLIFVFSVVFLKSYTVFQIQLNVLVTMCLSIYVIEVKPYKSKILNYLDIINESFFLVYSVFLFIFTDAYTDDAKVSMGLVLIAIIEFPYVINTCYQFYIIYRLLRYRVYHRYCRKRSPVELADSMIGGKLLTKFGKVIKINALKMMDNNNSSLTSSMNSQQDMLLRINSLASDQNKATLGTDGSVNKLSESNSNKTKKMRKDKDIQSRRLKIGVKPRLKNKLQQSKDQQQEYSDVDSVSSYSSSKKSITSTTSSTKKYIKKLFKQDKNHQQKQLNVNKKKQKDINDYQLDTIQETDQDDQWPMTKNQREAVDVSFYKKDEFTSGNYHQQPDYYYVRQASQQRNIISNNLTEQAAQQLTKNQIESPLKSQESLRSQNQAPKEQTKQQLQFLNQQNNLLLSQVKQHQISNSIFQAKQEQVDDKASSSIGHSRKDSFASSINSNRSHKQKSNNIQIKQDDNNLLNVNSQSNNNGVQDLKNISFYQTSKVQQQQDEENEERKSNIDSDVSSDIQVSSNDDDFNDNDQQNIENQQTMNVHTKRFGIINNPDNTIQELETNRDPQDSLVDNDQVQEQNFNQDCEDLDDSITCDFNNTQTHLNLKS